MLRAFAVKGVVLAIAAVLCLALPAGWIAPALAALVVATIGFFTYTIAHPRSRFFVPVVSRLATTEPVVALTFDDGPDPEVTPRVLDALRARGVHATFFVLGARAARHPEIIERMQREGHAVGTHTQHHRIRFHFARPAYVQREIEDAIAVVGDILHARPVLFRPPQGVRTPLFASAWHRLRGLTCVTWSVRGFDSRPTTAQAITARIVPKLAPGAIVTLHDGTGLGGGRDREPTLRALDEILTTCEARGLRCVAMA